MYASSISASTSVGKYRPDSVIYLPRWRIMISVNSLIYENSSSQPLVGTFGGNLIALPRNMQPQCGAAREIPLMRAVCVISRPPCLRCWACAFWKYTTCGGGCNICAKGSSSPASALAREVRLPVQRRRCATSNCARASGAAAQRFTLPLNL